MAGFIGLDIGGANLKAASTGGRALSRSFPLWKRPEALSATIRQTVAALDVVHPDAVALTMTGELADCFRTKSEGVGHIIGAVKEALPETSVEVWSTAGRFLPTHDAIAQPLLVAAANWHAQATWWASQFPGAAGLLLDMGTTTTDIIPFQSGKVVAVGRTDLGRLEAGELVYTGMRRTPLCALSPTIDLNGRTVPVAAELFATMLDVSLWLGQVPEDLSDLDTANGRPATRSEAAERLARMLCADTTELTPDGLTTLARSWATLQQLQIQRALDQVLAQRPHPEITILAGSGEFVLESVVSRQPRFRSETVIRAQHVLSAEQSEAACATAVCQLLARKLGAP